MLHSIDAIGYDTPVPLRRNPVPFQTVVRLAPALLAIALYAVTLYGTYVYDDVLLIQQDPRVRAPGHWKELWTTDYFNGGVDNLYRPIVSSSYALEWFIHGDRPWYFHAVNILLHALVCMAVAEFTRRCLMAAGMKAPSIPEATFDLNRRRRGVWQGESLANITALYAGLLFAAHPIHVEAVANIVGRAELLCALAVFGALIILANRPLTYARAGFAILLAIIGVLSKEHGLLQPLLWAFFLLLIWPRIKILQTPVQRDAREPDAGVGGGCDLLPRERNVLQFLVLIVSWIWAAYVLLREHFLKFEWDRNFLDPIIQPLIQSAGISRVMMPVVLLGHYTSLILRPIHLSSDYGTDVIGAVVHPGDPYLWIGGFTVFVLLAALCWAAVNRRWFVLFCLLSLGVTYSMIGNIVTLIGTIFAERIAYIPSAFVLILIAMMIARLPRKLGAGFMIVVLSLFSVRTISWAQDWNDPLTLYRVSLESCPRSLQLQIMLAQEYHNAGREPDAQRVMAQATQMHPGTWQAWMRRAWHALDVGQLDAASTYLHIAKNMEANPQLMVVQERLSRMTAARNWQQQKK